jgi:hypothetical protein
MLHRPRGADEHKEVGAQRGRGVKVSKIEENEVIQADLCRQVGQDRREDGGRIRWEGWDFLQCQQGADGGGR